MATWYLMRLKDAEKKAAISRTNNVVANLMHAYVVGDMDCVRRSDAEIMPKEFGEVSFNVDRGNAHLHDGKTVESKKPYYPCPDCGSLLFLNKKYFKYGNTNVPWFYVCKNKENGCKGKAMAKVHGSLLFIPVDADTRRARKLTTEQFDRLWVSSPELNDAHMLNDKDIKKLENEVKGRAYRWLAKGMLANGIQTKNISQMSIPELRVAYTLCRDANLDEVYQVPSIKTAIPKQKIKNQDDMADDLI